MKIIGIVGAKGGTAKTTTAVSLSAIFAQKHKVALVDADRQQSAFWWLSRVHQPFNIFAETDPGTLRRLRRLEERFDYVFIDGPPAPPAAVITAIMETSDFLIIPTPPSPLDFNRTLAFIQQTIEPKNKDYRILLTRVHPLSGTEARQVLGAFKSHGYKHFHRYVRELKAHQRAAVSGDNILDWIGAYQEQAANDYKGIASELRRIL